MKVSRHGTPSTTPEHAQHTPIAAPKTVSEPPKPQNVLLRVAQAFLGQSSATSVPKTSAKTSNAPASPWSLGKALDATRQLPGLPQAAGLLAGAVFSVGCIGAPFEGNQTYAWDELDDASGELWLAPERPVPARKACSPEKVAEVLAPATETSSAVFVDCNLTLSPSDVVSKRLVLQGEASSGVTVACDGASLDSTRGVGGNATMLEIRSRRFTNDAGELAWEPVHDVSVSGCNITGAVRLWGMARNGEGKDLGASSRSYGHTTRARENAPSKIALDDLGIVGTGSIPVYFAPGVNHSSLTNSHVSGTSVSVAIYLDAESHANRFDGNVIAVDTEKREVFAVDASSYNSITNNNFSGLDNGGIYLYRNCGEGGTIRHTTPSHNDLSDNFFYYKNYDGSNPSVLLGSRDGKRGYCDDDEGLLMGSSASDHDHARFNTVTNNEIMGRDVSDMIREGNESNHSNVIEGNTRVSTPKKR